MKRGPLTIGSQFLFFHSEKSQVHPAITIQEGMYLFKRTVANELEGEHSVKGVQARQIKTTSEVTS